MPTARIPEVSEDEQRALFGPMDRNLRALRDRFGVRMTARRGALVLEGPDERALGDAAGRVRAVLERLREIGGDLPEDEIAALLLDGTEPRPAGARGRRPAASSGPAAPARAAHGARRPNGPPRAPEGPSAAPEPRTANQRHYVEAIRKHDVVLSIGPAGTGKTYLAVSEAVTALRSGAVRRLILTRPAVEAGEKLGFLPGDFQAKINPYLRPLYDALGELLPHGEVQRYVDADVIEIVPLAYMRGRTLKNAFIILDEAQNTTPAQMKMFLTRMGLGSKVVVTGDITQVDLPEDTPSGLVQSMGILDGVPGIEIIRFGPEDIQRHPLVQQIVDAYDRWSRRASPEAPRGPSGDDGSHPSEDPA